MRNIICFLSLVLFGCFVTGCNSQTKEQLVHDGQQFVQQGNYRGAVAFYKKALAKDKNYFEARYLLADAYLSVGEYDKAEKEFQKVAHQSPDYRQLQLKLAEICLLTDRVDQALKKLKKYIKDHPEAGRAYDLLGCAHAVQKDFPAAEDAFVKAVQLSPKNFLAKFHQARLYLQLDKKDEARRLLKEVISGAEKDDRKVVPAYYLLAELEKSAGNRDQAIALYQELQKHFSNLVRAAYLEGVLQLEKKEFDKVAAIADSLIKKHSSRYEGYCLKGLLSYVEGDYGEAEVALKKAIKINGGDFASIYFLGASYLKQGKLDLALNQFQKILNNNPDHVKSRVMVGMILLRQKQIDEAITEFKKALTIDYRNAEAHNLLGSAYLNKGKYDEAMEEFDRAVEINPGLVDAYINKGVSSLIKGDDLKKTEADFVKALQAAPEVMNTRLLLSALYMRSQNYEKALCTMKEGLTGKPDDALLYTCMAQVWMDQKQTDKALEALCKAKEIKPDYPTPYLKAAAIYVVQGKYDDAIAEYDRLLQKNPENIKAIFLTAALYELKGDDEKAQEYFIRASKMNTPVGYGALAQYYARTGKLDEALNAVDEGLKKFVDDPNLLEVKGRLLLAADDFERASRILLKLEKINPGQGVPLLVRGYLDKGDMNHAVHLAKEVVGGHPELDYGYLLLSDVYLQNRDYDKAEEALRQGLKARSNQSLKLRLRLGALYELRGYNDAAMQCYQAAEKDFPGSVAPRLSRAVLLDRLGNKRQALNLYQDILRKNRNSTVCLNNLAYLYLENYSENRKGLDLAMKAYQITPNSPEIMETLGYAFFKNGRAEEAVKMLEKAHRQLKNNPMADYHLALAYADNGQPQKAVTLLHTLLAAKIPFPKRAAAEKLLIKLEKQGK